MKGPFGRGTTLRGLTHHGYKPLTNWDVDKYGQSHGARVSSQPSFPASIHQIVLRLHSAPGGNHGIVDLLSETRRVRDGLMTLAGNDGDEIFPDGDG